MVTKNVQSIRSDARLEDLVLELKELDFDFLFLTETWRDSSEEMLEVGGGTKMFLSGGGPHQGVGIVVSKRCWGSMQDVVFHAYSPRVCSLTFRLANKEFVACVCYMPTSWDTDEAVMEVYALLDLILYSRDCVNRLPLLGGDLNACIGQMFFFFLLAPFFSRRVWLELFYWTASRHVPFIYRRLRMCRETGPSPSHCSLGAGWDAAGGWGKKICKTPFLAHISIKIKWIR